MYQDKITDFIKSNPIFFIGEIQNNIGLGGKKKAIMNTEISRMEKKGIVKRIAHGLYIVPQTSCFGITFPNEKKVAEKVYLENNIGFASGPTFLNQIGLSTWMPRKIFIKSNLYKKNIGLKTFIVEAPRTTINANNKRYIQLLDCIEDMNKYAIDCMAPHKIIYQYINNSKLDTTKLLLFCHKYYKRAVLEQLYIILEENYETT